MSTCGKIPISLKVVDDFEANIIDSMHPVMATKGCVIDTADAPSSICISTGTFLASNKMISCSKGISLKILLHTGVELHLESIQNAKELFSISACVHLENAIGLFMKHLKMNGIKLECDLPTF